ncbi:MAG: hypothetical protein R3C10_27695 [Pirellulales bacterium]
MGHGPQWLGGGLAVTAEDLLVTLADHHIELYLDAGQLGYRCSVRCAHE